MAGQTIPNPKPAEGKKAQGWVARHKAVTIVAAVALIGLYVMLRRNAAASAAANTTAGGVNPTTGLPLPTGVPSDPTNAAGVIDPNSVAGLMSQLLSGQAGLAGAIAGLTPTTPTPGTATPPGTTKTATQLHAEHMAHLHQLHVLHTLHQGAAPAVPATKPQVHTYTIQRGETLQSIASKLHIAGGWQALYRENAKAIGAPGHEHIPAGLVLHY